MVAMWGNLAMQHAPTIEGRSGLRQTDTLTITTEHQLLANLDCGDSQGTFTTEASYRVEEDKEDL